MLRQFIRIGPELTIIVEPPIWIFQYTVCEAFGHEVSMIIFLQFSVFAPPTGHPDNVSVDPAGL